MENFKNKKNRPKIKILKVTRGNPKKPKFEV